VVPEATAVGLEVRLLRDQEREAAGSVAARALRDDPLFVYLHGDDPIVRMAGSYAAFRDAPAAHAAGGLRRLVRPRPSTSARPASTVWGAVVDGYVVATAGAAPPGGCFVDQLSPELRRRPTGPEGAPGSPDRLARVLAELSAHHCEERHWHVGPVGVEPGLQGRGLGAAVMHLLCELMDSDGEAAFLETEKPENVVFYRRLGFDVVSESQLTGLHTWFMRRPPLGPAAPTHS
jgi:ribosomal protein S18 acetylase RimI-like enzyme